MKCVIPGNNVKIFSKAIHSLAKIGTELFIEPNINNFAIRTINCNKSAFASFIFEPSFFTEYNADGIGSSTADFDGKCKVSIKACLGIFKNMKQVEFCKIYVQPNVEKLMVELKCRLDTKKLYVISVIEVETLQATYNTSNSKNKISGKHNIFADLANGFQMSEEEITLEPTTDKLLVKNYVEGTFINPKFMRTELTFKAEEFKRYEVEEPTSITFCLREFRAFLNFAEMTNMDFQANFNAAGEPAVFIIEDHGYFEGNLVMSTLSPDDVTFMETSHISTKTKQQVENIQQKTTVSESNNSAFSTTQFNTSLRHSPSKIRRNSKEFFKETEEFDVTFRSTEHFEEMDYVPSSPNREQPRKRRAVFTRCFRSTFQPYCENTTGNAILAGNSDVED